MPETVSIEGSEETVTINLARIFEGIYGPTVTGGLPAVVKLDEDFKMRVRPPNQPSEPASEPVVVARRASGC